jgi:hypothetical protein
MCTIPGTHTVNNGVRLGKERGTFTATVAPLPPLFPLLLILESKF